MSIGEIQHQAIDVIGQRQELDPVRERLQQALNQLYNQGGPLGRQVEDLLHGVPLGHPLHPVLVTVPIGAWTVTAILDLLEAAGRREVGPGSDAALTVGLLGALASAMTGMTDWKDTDGEASRIGLIHGVLNTTAAGLYMRSLALRRDPESRPAARWLALGGYALVMVSGILGGDMVYRHRIGVNNSNPAPLGDGFIAVLDSAALGEGQMRRVEVAGEPVMLARQHGRVYALAEHCAHLGGPLSEGRLEEGCVQCPWHGSRFALADGAVVNGPATITQPSYAVREQGGRIEIAARE